VTKFHVTNRFWVFSAVMNDNFRMFSSSRRISAISLFDSRFEGSKQDFWPRSIGRWSCLPPVSKGSAFLHDISSRSRRGCGRILGNAIAPGTKVRVVSTACENRTLFYGAKWIAPQDAHSEMQRIADRFHIGFVLFASQLTLVALNFPAQTSAVSLPRSPCV
jgi:hypothetical protein